MRKPTVLISLPMLLALFCAPAHAATIYVKATASGTGTGASWTNAYTDLQDAMESAGSGDEIWVAAGTYYPTEEHGGTEEQNKSFRMTSGVSIYGGFAGTETARTGRDPSANETILSGDLDKDGELDSENCYSVFYNFYYGETGLDETAVLDGFTITGGFGTYGGGMFNSNASPTVTNCTFSGNTASSSGGGMCNYASSSPTVANCTFSGNTAGQGGGMYNNPSTSPVLTNCIFSENQGTYGGGMFNSNASPTLFNCTFSGNTSSYLGGGMYNSVSSSPVLINCTFSGNTASTYGGGIFNSNSSQTISNCILWGNTAWWTKTNELYNFDGTSTITSSDIKGSGGSGDGWDSDLGTDGGGNIDAAPGFVGEDDLHLAADSPCIDAGSDSLVPSGLDTDRDEEARIVGIAVDMGSDEFLDTDGDLDPDYSDDDDDDDGLSDDAETGTHGTDPLDADSDDDGLSDYDEINTHHTDPLDADSDDDGLSDGAEIDGDTDPLDSDSDDDGYGDGQEMFHETDPDTGLLIATTLHVDAASTGGALDGASWAGAFSDLQVALNVAISGDTIWVAAGTYYPSRANGGTGARYRSFQLMNGVALYGGFAGTESDLAARNLAVNRTILSGDIDGDGVLNDGNAYHVFYHPDSLGLDDTAVLDGVTVTGGYADGSNPHNQGGGMYNNAASPSLSNCIFRENSAEYGGGIRNYNAADPAVTNCTFRENHADEWGGGMFNTASLQAISGCAFIGNDAGYGGGMYHASSTTVVTNCSFSGNQAGTRGGGMYLYNTSPAIANCILWGNKATSGANEIYNSSAAPAIYNSDIEGSGGSGGGWDTTLGTDGGGNIDGDPGFTGEDDLHLTAGSPCIDTGDGSRVPSGLDTDPDGESRIVGPAVDMGADEFRDTDRDGLLDYEEEAIYDTDPEDADSDDDGLSDSVEVALGTDPNDADTDDDGLSDGDEENRYHTDPLTADAEADTDGDGITNVREADVTGTDPEDADSDDDGYGDGVEVCHGSDPNNSGDTPAAATLYVNEGATEGAGNGKNWTDAFIDLQVALDLTLAGDEIWVAAGTYYPTRAHEGTGERYKSFQMVVGVSIYGGFAGSETDLAQRDVGANETILSGDIDRDGILDSDNAYHVFYHPEGFTLDGTAVLDGFTVTGGYGAYGGGMYNYGSASPTVTNCTFSRNMAAQRGGGICNSSSSPTLTNCTFSENQAAYGGGIYNTSSSPTLTNCTFSENQATRGGGIYNISSSPSVTNCTFSENTVDLGGGMGNASSSSPKLTNCAFSGNTASAAGGGMYNESSSSPTLTNCTFIGNTTSGDGGGMYNVSSPSPTLTNCTFSGNTARDGGGMYNFSSSPAVSNCILWENTAIQNGNEILNVSSTPTLSFSDISGSGGSGAWDGGLGTDGGGNIDGAPGFLGNTDLHLTAGSPCIDAGSGSLVPSGLDTDLDGEGRIFGDAVDMGADEFVDADGDDLSDYEEAAVTGTDPADPDSDGDGLSDGAETDLGTNPNDADSDDDGLEDGSEVSSGLDPLTAEGPGVPILVSPETDETGIDLSARLMVAYGDGTGAEQHRSTRWQISLDDAFSTLAADLTSDTHLLTLTVPELVLDSETVCFWRVRFTGTDGLPRSWSGTGRFTTAADARGDEDGNHLPDDQELGAGDTPDTVPDPETGWLDALSHISFDAEDGTARQTALRLSDDGSMLTFFTHAPAEDAADAPPEDLDLGLFSIRIRVPAAGDSTSVRLYFSPSPLDEDTAAYKYDTVNGWLEYTGYTQLGDDLSFIAIELTDGGYGDADGTANGIIVDPLGTSTAVDDGEDDDGSDDDGSDDDDSGDNDSGDDDPADTDGTDNDTAGTSSGSGGGGCFIGELGNGEKSFEGYFFGLLMLAAGMLALHVPGTKRSGQK